MSRKNIGGIDVQLHIFLTSALNGDERLISRNLLFASGKESQYVTKLKVCFRNFVNAPNKRCEPDSSVGIETDYPLDGPGSNPDGGRDFPPVQTGPGAHPAYCKMGTGSFPGVKCGRGVLLSTHPFLVPRSWKSRAITLPTLWATPDL